MKRIFLCSSFKDVASLFKDFVNTDLVGKTVTFIPTASLVEKVTFYVGAGRKALEKMGLIVDNLDISTTAPEEIATKLQTNDFIYVTGGNTFFLLQEMKKSGTDKMIVEQIMNGKTYIGESAGAVILSPNIEYITLMDNRKEAPDLESLSALEVVDFYPVPHHTNFPFVGVVNKIIAQYQHTLPLYPISNKEAISVRNRTVELKSSTQT